MSEWIPVIVSGFFTIINLVLLGYMLKLYTEFFKEKVKR